MGNVRNDGRNDGNSGLRSSSSIIDYSSTAMWILETPLVRSYERCIDGSLDVRIQATKYVEAEKSDAQTLSF